MQSVNGEAYLDIERVRTLYANARMAIGGVIIGALLFSYFYWYTLDRTLLLTWLSVVVVINLLRLMHVERATHRLYGNVITPENVAQCEQRLHLGVLFSAISWAAVSLFPYQGSVLVSQLFNASLLVAMSSAGIVNHMTSLKLGKTYLSWSLLPLIARSIWEGGEQLLILAGATATYYIVFSRMAEKMHLAVIDNLRLKLENKELALRDALTGLWNRRQLYLYIEQLMPQLERNGETFSIILMDLDHFKRYNDTEGHSAGDVLLKSVADIIQHESRDEDLVVRYGGEEFLVVLPRADVVQARQVAERIRLGVRTLTAASMSAGIAEYEAQLAFDDMIRRADRALYQAKSQGRNKVVEFLVYAEEAAL